MITRLDRPTTVSEGSGAPGRPLPPRLAFWLLCLWMRATPEATARQFADFDAGFLLPDRAATNPPI